MAIKNIKDNLKRLKDADPVELAGQLNSWLQESGEALRLRIEDEVEKAVTKRGFVKRSEFLKLEARISDLEGKPKNRLKPKSKPRSKVRSSSKPEKKQAGKPVKKKTAKSAPKSAAKSNNPGNPGNPGNPSNPRNPINPRKKGVKK